MRPRPQYTGARALDTVPSRDLRLLWAIMCPEPADDGMIGALIADRYRIDAVIGRGGMSTVYLATDTQLGRPVAIKSFRPDLADADDIRRQRDEVKLLASLNHPTLVTLFDAVSDADGRASLVLEYVEGRDLRETLAAGPLDEQTAALIALDIASALAYVHDRGIVHRDLKPGNLLIPNSRDGARAKLADFGIARLVDGTRMTATGNLIGTAAYLSPEQALGGIIGPSSDIYSFGLVLLESLTGSREYGGSNIEAAIARLNRDPEIPELLGPVWVNLLERMTAREPDDRISARDAVPVLAGLAGGASVTLPDPTLSHDDPTIAFAQTVAFAQTALAPPPPSPSPSPSPSGPSTAETIVATKILPAASPPPFSSPQPPRSLSAAQPSTQPSTQPSARRMSRRLIAVIIVGVICALAIPIAITAVAGSRGDTVAPSLSPSPSLSYPVVDGTVGDHLKQLQKSVQK